MRRFYPPFVGGRSGFGLLLIRLAVGAAMILHGWQKIGNPFHWMDKMGSAPPALLQGLAVLAEVGGGAALVVGLLTPLATLGLACDMAYALFLVHLPKGDPFVAASASGSSYEKALVYLAASICVMLTGPGRYSLDALLFRNHTSVILKASPWARSTAA
jgi:putative oxidoreductase